MPAYDFALEGINWSTDSIKIALFPNTFSPSVTTQFNWSDISAAEASGTGYTAGGNLLLTKTRVFATPVTTFSGANLTFGPVTLSGIRYGVCYKDTGTASTSRLISFFNVQILGADITVVSGNIALQWSPNGIITVNYVS